jgi:hypothetical protein
MGVMSSPYAEPCDGTGRTARLPTTVTRVRLSIPLAGLVFYGLSLLTLWLIDPSGLEIGELSSLDAGDPPPG